MPASKVKVNVSGTPTWKDSSLAYARVNNTWKPCKQVWTKVGDAWKIVYDLTIEDVFSGSAGTLTSTPGNVPWQAIKGTFNLSGSGNAVATSNSAIAAVDTGLTTGLSVEIDNNAATNLSGMGTAFWIKDQSNWWGAQIYYEFYSYSDTYSTTWYYDCTFTPYTGTYHPAYYAYEAYREGVLNFYVFSPYGIHRTTGVRPCNPGGKYAYYTTYDGINCDSNNYCTPNPSGSGGTPCTSPNRWYICRTDLPCYTCGNLPGYTPSSSFAYGNILPPGSSCPYPYWVSFSYQVSYPQCYVAAGVQHPTNYCYTSYVTVAAYCTQDAGTSSFYRTYTNDTAGNPQPASSCTPSSSTSCTQTTYTVYTPYTAYKTVRKTKLLKSSAGSISEIAATTDNGSTGTIGYVKSTMSMANPTQAKVDVVSYAGERATGAQYATISYTLPSAETSALTGATKHGVMVSAVPTTTTTFPPGLPLFSQPSTNTGQGYSINRFKVNI